LHSVRQATNIKGSRPFRTGEAYCSASRWARTPCAHEAQTRRPSFRTSSDEHQRFAAFPDRRGVLQRVSMGPNALRPRSADAKAYIRYFERRASEVSGRSGPARRAAKGEQGC
ncbi:MAG: hypothetical protein AAF550_00060, partial [Myxococcota bacterium]